MAEVYCGSEPCPLFLNSTCVFYTGESLLYIGVQNNDTLETIIVKINQAFQNAGVGYAFTNGLIQPTPFQPVQLGGALTQNTTIGGNFTLSFSGNVQAARHITTGGSSSQFVKGDGTLDSTAYQPAANYITGLSGDATASGPGVAVMTLNTVNFSSGTFGNGNTIPIVTVNAKGLVTNITPVPITLPPLPLTFIGDVVGSGFTGSSITLLMQNVNANPYNTITPLKFSVNGKGLVTGASPITASDIVNILGYYPGTSGTSGSDGTSGTSGTTGTSGTSGTSATSGTSGTTGTSGTSATSGTSGTSGTDGTGGTSGTSGSTGTSGTSGTSGTAGTSGTSGTSGSSGSSGTSGSTGTSGSSGTTGTSGSSGTTGTSGSSGTSGTTGTSGSSGTSGTTGLDGTNGTSGTSGTTGTSGSSGTSGTSATSGSSGTSGTTGTSGTSGLSGDRFKTTSTTTYTLQAPGNPGTLTVDPGLAYTVGQSIIIAYDANNHNEAEVTSYDSITGVINFVTFTLTGSGTYSSWFVNIDGASGGDGSSGTSGTAGTSGSSGTSGTTGTSGSSGTSGTSATDGTSGSSGTSAIDGTSGTSGTSGTTGTSGSSGTSGTTGTSGSSGTSGTSATDGTGGTSGTSGSSGTSGTTGTSGTSATSGTSGTSATSGTTGTSGTSGISGTGGSSGTSGTSATSGTSGTSGATGASGTSGTSGTSVAVSGTTNTMAKFTSATTIGNSALTDNGSTLTYTGSAVTSPTINVNSGNSFVAQGHSNNGGFAMNNSSTYWGLMWNYAANDWRLGYGTTTAQVGWNLRWDNGSTVWANGSFRAPFFYDSDDTAYYIDGAGTSNLYLANFGDNTSNDQGIGIYYGNYNGGYGRIRFYQSGSNHSTIHSFSNSWQGGSLAGHSTGAINISGNTGVTFGAWNNVDMWTDTSGNMQTRGSMRSPIFFDSSNTNYYIDPASTTSLRTVGSWRADSAAWDGEFNGKIQYHSNSWYFQAAGDWLFRNSAGTNVVSINQSGVITGSLNGSASFVNGTSGGAIQSWDIRTISPSSMTTYRLGFGFTSWANNNSAPYADYLHLRSYSDNSGGADNLVMFLKSGIGMRIYQQTFGSGSAYSSFVDVLHSSNYSSYALPLSGGIMTGNIQMGSNQNLNIKFRTASAWDYSLIGQNDDFFIRDNPGLNYVSCYYNGGGANRYISLMNNLSVFASGKVTYTDATYMTGSPSYGFRFNNSSDSINALVVDNSGNTFAYTSHRAPIFYDSNNTGYYLDPASGSNLVTLTVADWVYQNSSGGMYWNPYSRGIASPENGGNSYGTIATVGSGRNGWSGYGIGTQWVLMSSGSGGGDNFGIHNNTHSWSYYWNGSYHQFYRGYVNAEGSMRSPIFYDSNNTSYYIDAASTSVLHTLLNIGGWLEVRSNVYATNPTTTAGLFFGWNKSGGNGEANIIVDGGSDTGQFLFQRYNGGGSYTDILQADIYGLTANSGTVNVFSDIRLKTNITNATPKLNDLMKLNVVNYEFVGEYDVLGKQLGFIAQEVEQIFPSLVREQDTRQYDDQGNYIKGYEDTKILKVGMEFAMLVKAMQEQQSIIDSLKSEIETLKQK